MLALILLGVAVSIVPGALTCLLADAARSSMVRRAVPSGRCATCGYSLEGLPHQTSVCPECGTPIAKHSTLRPPLPWAWLLWPLALGPAGVLAYISLSPDPTAERVVVLLLLLSWPHGLAVAVLGCAGWRRLPQLAPTVLIACVLMTAAIQVSELAGPIRGIPSEPAYGIDYDFHVLLPLTSVLLVLGNCGVIAAVSLASFLPARFWRWLAPPE